jgi:lipopolysaccharide assembly outer membrane protein LptD (OstA)
MKICLASIAVLSASFLASAQESARRDSLVSAVVDSSVARADIDTTVTYSAKDSIVFSIKERRMDLFGKGETNYQAIALKAERVSLNWTEATLSARGVRDTTKGDTTIGRPILKDGGEDYTGDLIRYNFRSRKGKITVGTTEMDEGFYRGGEIKKVEPNVLYVSNGRYTTCSLPDPHFYFSSPRMKVYVRDKVVAEPVYFCIADVPVFALPFGVFPSKGGRASGIIPPVYGEDGQRGKYFSRFGYYWAINDFLDFASVMSYYTRGGWENRSNFRYRLRYNFSGGLDTRITQKHLGESSDPDYSKEQDYYVSWVHGQELTPSSRFDVNFTFTSGNYLRNYSMNLDEFLTQDIYSNATYWKTWESANRTLSVNVSRRQNLKSGNVSEGLPNISFSQNRIFPFRSKTRSRGMSSGSSDDAGVLEMLGLDYSASFTNQRSKTSQSFDSIAVPGALEPIQLKEFRTDATQNLRQFVSVSVSPKVGRITVTPSLNFEDNREYSQFHLPSENMLGTAVAFHDSSSRRVAGRISAGVSGSTRLFGMMQPRIFGISAFRHTLSPSVGLTYSKQVYGDRIPKYSFVGSFGVSNNFEMKVQSSDTAKEEKIQLLYLGANLGYNFAADSMGLSDMGISFRTDIGRALNISGGASYNFYVFDPLAGNSGARVNRFLLTNQGRIADLTSFSLSIGTSYQAQKKTRTSDAGVPDNVLSEEEQKSNSTGFAAQKKTYYSIYDREDADFSIPWSVSLGYTFGQSQPNPRTMFRTSSMNFTLSFNLTDKWQISTTGSYDFVNKKHFIPSVDVTRDLHCWEMRFSWKPMGYLEGYRLEIRIKAPQLQDIKVTKQSSARGMYF